MSRPVSRGRARLVVGVLTGLVVAVAAVCLVSTWMAVAWFVGPWVASALVAALGLAVVVVALVGRGARTAGRTRGDERRRADVPGEWRGVSDG